MIDRKTGLRRFKGYEKPLVDERLDYAELVRRQIERCLICASDPEGEFASAVQVLEALIPEELKDDTYRADFESATVIEEKLKFEKFAGRRIGRQNRPMMRYRDNSAYNRHDIPYIEDKDGNKIIDWNNPLIISPQLVKESYINWHFRFNVAFNQFVRLGIAVRRSNRG